VDVTIVTTVIAVNGIQAKLKAMTAPLTKKVRTKQ
jgi:hypothetical protein